jgi:hypothetical protein
MNKKRKVVSLKVREYVRQILNTRNIDQMNMEDLRKKFKSHKFLTE